MRGIWCLLAVGVLATAGWAAAPAALPPTQPATPEPQTWEGLKLWPPRPVRNTAPAPSSVALAAADQQLLLGEISAGAVCLGELEPATAVAMWLHSVVPAAPGRERTGLSLAIVGKTAWLAWLEAPAGTPADAPHSLMLTGYDLAAQTASAPTEVATTRQGGLVAHNQQLWLAWLDPAESGSLSLCSWPRGNSAVVTWSPAEPGTLTGLGLADFGPDLGLPFVTSDRGQTSLWQAAYNGHRFFGIRKLRGSGTLGNPAAARVGNRLLTLFTVAQSAPAGHTMASDLVLAVTDEVGVQLDSTDYLADGQVNLSPALAPMERLTYLAYDAWSAPPGTPGAHNLGVFPGKIDSGP